VAWPIAAALGAAAASTLTTAGAAAAAGRQADLALQPIELALRVGLLLAAPCAGALLAAIAIPRGGGRVTLVAIGVGVPIGPLLVLRLDRMGAFGVLPALLTAAVLVLWGIAGALLAGSWWRRPSRTLERSALPTDPPGASDDQPELPGSDVGPSAPDTGDSADPPGPGNPRDSAPPPGASGRPGPSGPAGGAAG
jgi:hypothetical protein